MANSYWKKREEEAKRKSEQRQKEYDREIQRIYKRCLDNVNDQIFSWYAKYASEYDISISEARKRVDKLDIEAFAEKAKEYVKTKDFSKRANEEMRIYNLDMKINRLELLKAQIGLETISATDELEKFLSKELEGRTIEEVKRLSGILGDSVLDNIEKAKVIPTASFHNATFSDRLWQNQTLLKAELDKLLPTALIRGTNARTLAREVKTKLDTTTYNAERLMRTEICRVQTEASKMSFEKLGFTQYEFIAGPGACNVCKSVEAENEGIYDMDKMEIGVNAPPMHPNCMCSIAPYEDDEEYERWLNSYKDHGLSLEDWREKQKDISSDSVEDKFKFTPSNSIKEAEEYVSQFVDTNGFGSVGVSYKGVNLDVANKINNAIGNFYHMFDVGKLYGVSAPTKNSKLGKMISGAHAAFSPVRNSLLLNRDATKNAKKFLESLMDDKQAVSKYLDNPEKYNLSKIDKRVANVLINSKFSGRGLVAETVEEAIYHELGHSLEQYLRKDIDSIKLSMEKSAKNVSGYATDDTSEYIAECFASYMKGERVIDETMRNLFEGLRKK